MKKSKQITKTVEYRLCDVCEKNQVAGVVCMGCGKDLCDVCKIWVEYDPWTGEDNGDYWQKICDECNKKLKPYEDRALGIREEADEKIDNLRNKWLQECKNA